MAVFVGVLLLFCTLSKNGVRGSIHEYKNEKFIPRFDSFFFHGGSEGLYASKILDPSKTTPTNDKNKPLNGKSFIRYKDLLGSTKNLSEILFVGSFALFMLPFFIFYF